MAGWFLTALVDRQGADGEPLHWYDYEHVDRRRAAVLNDGRCTDPELGPCSRPKLPVSPGGRTWGRHGWPWWSSGWSGDCLGCASGRQPPDPDQGLGAPQPCASSPWVVRCRNRRARSRPSSRVRSGSASLVRLPRCRSASSPAGVQIQQFQQSPTPWRSSLRRRSGCSFAPQLEQHGTASPALRRARRRACRSAGVSGISALSRRPVLVARWPRPSGQPFRSLRSRCTADGDASMAAAILRTLSPSAASLRTSWARWPVMDAIRPGPAAGAPAKPGWAAIGTHRRQ